MNARLHSQGPVHCILMQFTSVKLVMKLSLSTDKYLLAVEPFKIKNVGSRLLSDIIFHAATSQTYWRYIFLGILLLSSVPFSKDKRGQFRELRHHSGNWMKADAHGLGECFVNLPINRYESRSKVH